MTAGFYGKGVFALLFVVGPWVVASIVSIRALAPRWPASLRALGASIIGIAGVIVSSELVGTFDQFRRAPLIAASLLLAVVVTVASRQIGARTNDGVAPVAPVSVKLTAAGAVALAAAALVVGLWTNDAASTYRNGITEYDSQSYHLSHAAGFVQHESTRHIDYSTADDSAPYHPLNVELLHGVGMRTLRTDILSVVLNPAFLLLGLLAAFWIGQRFGAGPAALVGFAVVAAAPFPARYASSGLNDYDAIALLLAAIAFALRVATRDDEEMPHRDVAIGLAGLAAGLALGSKLTMVTPIALLTLTVLLVLRKELSRVALFVAPMVLTGAYWYVRNWANVGSPVPSLHLPLFPETPMKFVDRLSASVLDFATKSDFWKDTVPDGLKIFFGRLWPLVVLAAVVGVVALVSMLRDKQMPARPVVIGLVITSVVTLLSYASTPTTAGGPKGVPELFTVNLRYVLRGLALVLVLLPAASFLRTRVSAVAIAGLVVLLAALVGPPRFATRALVFAVVAAVAALAVLRLPRPVVMGGIAVALVFGLAVGFPVTRKYERTRYKSIGNPTDTLLSVGRNLPPGTRVGVAGVPTFYALLGPRLANHVDYVGQFKAHHEFTDYTTCPSWREALRAGKYTWVVAQANTFGNRPKSYAKEWTQSMPGVQQVLDNAAGVVFKLPPTITNDGC